MKDVKTLGEDKDLLLEELYNCADELNDMDDLAWYCYKAPDGRVFIGAY